MPFMIDTQMKGTYIVTDQSITHLFLTNVNETSSGLLVSKHYEEVEAALYLAWAIREGKCYESIESYYHKDDDLKDVPHLNRILEVLEEQMDLLTDGAYQKYCKAIEDKSYNRMEEHRYSQELEEIRWDIYTLKEGRYYENEIHHHPGIPKIETVGRRLVDHIMDLVWRMDNNAPSIHEELFEALQKVNKNMSL